MNNAPLGHYTLVNNVPSRWILSPYFLDCSSNSSIWGTLFTSVYYCPPLPNPCILPDRVAEEKFAQLVFHVFVLFTLYTHTFIFVFFWGAHQIYSFVLLLCIFWYTTNYYRQKKLVGRNAEAHMRGQVSGLANTQRHSVIKLWAFGGGIRYPDSWQSWSDALWHEP